MSDEEFSLFTGEESKMVDRPLKMGRRPACPWAEEWRWDEWCEEEGEIDLEGDG